MPAPISITYIDNIPFSSNSPSADQPNMLINTNSLDTIWQQDHYSFNTFDGVKNIGGGLHKQSTYPALAAVPPTVSNQGALYTKTATSSGLLTETDLFYTPDASTNEYQLTRTVTGKFSKFGTNVSSSGWTFLPGGLLLQYGLATSSGTLNPNTTITFPVPFTTGAFSINCTILTTADSRFFVSVFDSSTTQFRAVTRDSGGSKISGQPFYWQAIGN